MIFSRITNVIVDDLPWFNFSWEPSYASFGVYTRPLAYPQAIRYKGEHDRTYLVYQDASFQPNIKFFDHYSGEWSKSYIIGTSLLGTNDHGSPSIAIHHGYLYVFFGAHNTWIQALRSEEPENPLGWISLTQPGIGSYPQPHITTQGKIFLFYRSVETNHKGRTWVLNSSTDGGKNWAGEEIIIDFPDYGIYACPLWENDSTVFLSWFKWDIYSPKSIESRFNIYFCKSDDFGSTWKSIRSKTLTSPICEQKEVVVFSSEPSQSYIWDMLVDSNHNPVILFTSDVEGSPYYYLARWNHSEWLISRITPTTSLRNPGLIKIVKNQIRLFLIKGKKVSRGGDLYEYVPLLSYKRWIKIKKYTNGCNVWSIQRVLHADNDLSMFFSYTKDNSHFIASIK